LTPLQLEILGAIKCVDGFFLSGGSALAAGYLGHRRSVDIDLFVVESGDVDALVATIRAAASTAGWGVEMVRSYPGFKRLSVRKGEESTLVDIIHEVCVGTFIHKTPPWDEYGRVPMGCQSR